MVKTTLQIDGMACGMCESHVNDAVRNACKVKKVTSSHKKGECEIISEEPLDEGALRSAISDMGYLVLGVTAGPYVKKGLFG